MTNYSSMTRTTVQLQVKLFDRLIYSTSKLDAVKKKPIKVQLARA